MDSAILTLFASLPLAVVILSFSKDIDEEKWITVGAFLLIAIVLLAFFNANVPDFLGYRLKVISANRYDEPIINWSMISKWIYICLTTLLPAAIFLYFIIRMDRKRPEPMGAMLLTILLGIIAAFAVTVLEKPLFIGGLVSETSFGFKDALSKGFQEIAFPSEFSKWLFLFIFLGSNKHYDEYLDGVVYSVCLAMGFAGVLSVWFMLGFIDCSVLMFLTKGMTTFLILIPVHFVSGAVMGYYMAIGTKDDKIIQLLLSLIIPILIDGVICSILAMLGGSWWCYLIIIILLIALSFMVYRHIIHLMRLDGVSH